MSQPTFSIITCTYNAEHYLAETLASVEEQTCQDFEHIFVDAFSADKTMAIITEYEKRHPGKVHVFQQKPCGISNAMNLGASYARGKLIAHLHSDDLYASPSTLATVASYAKQQPAEWYTGDCIIVNEDGTEYSREQKSPYSWDALTRKNVISHPSTFVTREAFNELGGFQPFRYAMDYDLWLRLGARSAPVQIPEYLSKFRRHGGGLSTKEYLNALREDYGIRKRLHKPAASRFFDWLRYGTNIAKYRAAIVLHRI